MLGVSEATVRSQSQVVSIQSHFDTGESIHSEVVTMQTLSQFDTTVANAKS